jgi:hypothetical protein
MNLIGLDAWIEGDSRCTYCGQLRCVCGRDDMSYDFDREMGIEETLEAQQVCGTWDGKRREDRKDDTSALGLTVHANIPDVGVKSGKKAK